MMSSCTVLTANELLDCLKRLNIIKYPPPLYCYAWELLTEEEQKVGMKQLQDINRDYAHKELEAKSGHMLPKATKGFKDDPNEWVLGERCILGSGRQCSARFKYFELPLCRFD